MSSVLQSLSELVPKSLKAWNAAAAKLLMSWGSMASPVLNMQADSLGIQPSIPSSKGHWPALVSPPPWSLRAWLTMEGGRLTWLWAPGTEAWAWCGTQQLWTLLLRVTIDYKDSARQASFAATKAEAAKMPKISWPPQQLPLTTSGNWDHWCVWQVHCPFEWSCEETCWCGWGPQGVPVAPPASVPGCGQGKCCQHIGLCASLI